MLTPLLRARHIELHARLVEGSPADHPVIETRVADRWRQRAGSASAVGAAVRRRAADQAERPEGISRPNPGRNGFAKSRLPAARSKSNSRGLRRRSGRGRNRNAELDRQGNLNGELQMTVAGIEKVIPALGLEKMLDDGVPQARSIASRRGSRTKDVSNLLGALDRAMPGLGKVVSSRRQCRRYRRHQRARQGRRAGRQEGPRIPLRFVDGAVYLGPIKVAQIPRCSEGRPPRAPIAEP